MWASQADHRSHWDPTVLAQMNKEVIHIPSRPLLGRGHPPNVYRNGYRSRRFSSRHSSQSSFSLSFGLGDYYPLPQEQGRGFILLPPALGGVHPGYISGHTSSNHVIVSSSTESRPFVPLGARYMGHSKITWSAVCSS